MAKHRIEETKQYGKTRKEDVITYHIYTEEEFCGCCGCMTVPSSVVARAHDKAIAEAICNLLNEDNHDKQK